ncbi:MAG TPA: alpha amylase C-terminal domain-containing protein, partial [Longimicrobium sp.]|nr:alpha amylase C-terminal domain-containing protein [Longimicrobium sp.]
LEDGWFVDTDPVDWDKLHRFAGIQHLYRDLIRLRRNWWDTTRGLRGEHVRVHHVNHGAKVVAYHRWQHGGPRDDVVAAGNFSHRPLEGYRVGFPRGGEWRVRFNSDWNGYSPDFGNHPSHHTRAEPVPWDGMPFSATVGLGPYTAILLSQE